MLPRRLAAFAAAAFAVAVFVAFSFSFFLAMSFAATVRGGGRYVAPDWAVYALKASPWALAATVGLLALHLGTSPRERPAVVVLGVLFCFVQAGFGAALVNGWRPPAPWVMVVPTLLLAAWLLVLNDPARPPAGSPALAWVGIAAAVALGVLATVDGMRGVPAGPVTPHLALIRQAALFVAVGAQCVWGIRLATGLAAVDRRIRERRLARGAAAR